MNSHADTLTSALAEYGNYLRLMVDRPELGSWAMAKKYLHLSDAKDVWAAETIDSERYLWSVGYLLHVVDRILILDGSDSYRPSIETHLRYHAEILRAVWSLENDEVLGNHWRDESSERLIELIQRVIA